MWDEEHEEYYWVVLCKNHHYQLKQSQAAGHPILLGETDSVSPPPHLETDFKVRCDDCGKEFSYGPRELLRHETEPPLPSWRTLFSRTLTQYRLRNKQAVLPHPSPGGPVQRNPSPGSSDICFSSCVGTTISKAADARPLSHFADAPDLAHACLRMASQPLPQRSHISGPVCSMTSADRCRSHQRCFRQKRDDFRILLFHSTLGRPRHRRSDHTLWVQAERRERSYRDLLRFDCFQSQSDPRGPQ